MHETRGILVGKGTTPQHLLYAMANRHGLIAGATGTGKTVSVRVLAEGLAHGGVAVVLADVKGDLSGIGQPALDDPKLAERAQATGVGELVPAGCPVVHWDIFGKRGHPIRTTISEMGPFLLARLLSLTPAQEARSTSLSGSQTRRGCCYSTSRTCTPCWSTSRRTPRC